MAETRDPVAQGAITSAALIVNPYSSGMTPRRERRIVQLLRERFPLQVLRTERANHAQELAREAVESGADLVVACGGDGTANEVLNGLDVTTDSAAQRPVFAVLPAGATNVLARGLGFPNDPVKGAKRLAEAIAQERWHPITVGQVDERRFLFCAGIGIDGETVKRKETSRKGRRSSDLAYLTSGVGRFAVEGGKLRDRMTIRIDDGDELRAACLFCGNIDPYTYLGRIPMRMMPGARVDNGLSLVMPERLGIAFALREASAILARGDRRSSFPDKRRDRDDVDEVAIVCDDPQPVQADGEYLGDRTDVTLRALRNAVRLVW